MNSSKRSAQNEVLYALGEKGDEHKKTDLESSLPLTEGSEIRGIFVVAIGRITSTTAVINLYHRLFELRKKK